MPFTSLSAQNVRGHLTGRVVADETVPLTGVRVTIDGPSLQGVREALTNEAGVFRVLELPIGSYTVEITHIGYRQVIYEDVQISLGRVRTLGDVQLEAEAVELSPLRVVATAPVIDPVSTTIGSGLDAEQFESLPIGRRDYQSIVNILPHANESFVGDGVTIGGSTGLENTYYVDGANVTDPFLGAGGTRLPWNFIESLRVRNGGYEAEYGKALGGIVDAVTYSGGNEFEASVFGFFTGSALAGTPRTGLNDLRADAFHTFDVGLRLGGPIIVDRLWYSAAYNPRVESIDREIPGHGVFEDRQTIHAFAGKISWQPYSNTSIDLSVFGDPSTHDAVGQLYSFSPPSQLENPDPYLNVRMEGGTAATLRLRQQIGSQVTLVADVSRHWRSYAVEPDTTTDELVPLFIDFENDTWSGGSGSSEDGSSRRTAAGVSATALLGPHTAKLGAEFEENHIDYRYDSNLIFKYDTDLFLQSVGITGAPYRNRIPAVYLQDSWQLTPRLAVNAGIRWSRQQLVGDDGAGVQTFPNQWQPRLGAVYQLGRLGTQRLFASYGRYYQQLPLHFATLFYGPYGEQLSWFSSDPRPGGIEADSTLNLTTDASDFPEVSGLRVEYFDEVTAGYERALGKDYVLGARGVLRVLRAAFGYGIDFSLDNPFIIGNLGQGELDFLPTPSRKYTALELTLRRAGRHRLQGFISYVLSRVYGNYTGLFSSDQGQATPNQNVSYLYEEQGPNSTGLLPNDRTHVLKLSGSYEFPFGLTAGTYATVQSGTPLNEFGAGSLCTVCYVFLVERGLAGRSSTLWDLNFSFTYALPIGSQAGGRIFLDLLHVGNPRSSAWTDQVQFLSQDADGNQINPNPTFGETLAYQPPMAARLGFEVAF